jgi:hypothetical protein
VGLQLPEGRKISPKARGWAAVSGVGTPKQHLHSKQSEWRTLTFLLPFTSNGPEWSEDLSHHSYPVGVRVFLSSQPALLVDDLNAFHHFLRSRGQAGKVGIYPPMTVLLFAQILHLTEGQQLKVTSWPWRRHREKPSLELTIYLS